MQTLIRRLLSLVVTAVTASGSLACAAAAPDLSESSHDYPSRPVTLIEPFGAGGGPDIMGRLVGQKLSELWGQPVTLENHPGGGATFAPALVSKSPADGYTLLVHTSAQAYVVALLKNLPYDPSRDFVAIAPLTTQPYVLVDCNNHL